MQTLYHLALVLHIAGLTTMAGTTLVDYVLFQQFWKQVTKDRAGSLAVNETMSRLPMLLGIGMILLIVSGVTMMAVTNGAFGEQVWFRIKFALVVAIIINGVAVGRRQGIKLKKLLSAERARGSEAGLLQIKRTIRLFHLVQLILFVVIFILSVFKFN